MAKKKQTPDQFLELAQKHLAKVQGARTEPDWDDLAIYGLYCLEALVRAAVLKDGGQPDRTHWGKLKQAKDLSIKLALPSIDGLMQLLNEARKAQAYGDQEFDESSHNPDETANQIKAYFDSVANFVKK